ncbi:LacI family DNA-binding transcriptional regulator [Oryzobacter telluris]|uniref:LacI family DNA-binding transcriptional regulator n=1 Tax=Oryzobacter telluris TaxID=3149179 RepID=UPI00370D7AE4
MATRRDVALRAGVSEATVSYTLSGKRTISPATQARVRQAMDELGYQPHTLATALAGGSSPVVAVLFPVSERAISNADMEYVLGAASAARAAGLHVLLWPTTDDEVADVVNVHRSGLIGGVVLMEVLLDDPRVVALTEAGVPCALIGRTAEEDEIPFVDRDFDAVAEVAVAHLAELGHEEVWFLSGPKQVSDRRFGALVRAETAFRASCRRHGIRGSVRNAAPMPGEGARVAAAIGKAARRPTALVGLNVEATLGLLQAAPHAGISVPRDLSVVSIGTPEPWAAAAEPPLTSVSAPASGMGAAALHQLVDRMNGSASVDQHALFAGEFILRESTAPPPLVTPAKGTL